MPSILGRRRLARGAAALAAVGVGACATPPRLAAVPRERTYAATVLGLPNERFFFLNDPQPVIAEFAAAQQRQLARAGVRSIADLPVANLLAVSGGGEDGAFGAGLLCGWTEQGGRPIFDLVTGVSTGALTAPFAFLGSAYDPQLRDVYTNITLKDVAVERGILNGMLGDAMADTTPLLTTISRHLNEAMLAALAQAYDQGRLLLIGTTNLDAQVPVVWNIGAIAKAGVQRGDGRALELVRRILLASAAVPGAFPPVMIDVEVDGHRYQEMHVDGGAFAQAFLYPTAAGEARLARGRAREPVRRMRIYVIRNARLDPDWASIERRTLGIAGRAIATMIYVSGGNDVLRMYNRARADGIDFNLAFIGADFTTESKDPFDQSYMRALFDFGQQQGRAGGGWVQRPPFLDPAASPAAR